MTISTLTFGKKIYQDKMILTVKLEVSDEELAFESWDIEGTASRSDASQNCDTQKIAASDYFID